MGYISLIFIIVVCGGALLWMLAQMGVFDAILQGVIVFVFFNFGLLVLGTGIWIASAYLPDWANKTVVIVLCGLYALGGVAYFLTGLRNQWRDVEYRRAVVIGLFAMGVGGYFAIHPELPAGYLNARRERRLHRANLEQLSREVDARVRAGKANLAAQAEAAKKGKVRKTRPQPSQANENAGEKRR